MLDLTGMACSWGTDRPPRVAEESHLCRPVVTEDCSVPDNVFNQQAKVAHDRFPRTEPPGELAIPLKEGSQAECPTREPLEFLDCLGNRPYSNLTY